jgi:hypothetical protein
MVSVDPGGAGFSKVRVKPARSFWRGTPKTRNYKVAVKPRAEVAQPLILDGTFLQEAILPPWFLRALIALLLLLLALALLWLLVLQPQIRSSAAEALQDFGYSPLPSSKAAGTAAAAASATSAASAGSSQAASPSAAGSASSGASPSPSASPSASASPSPSASAGPSGGTSTTGPSKPPPSATPIIVTAPPVTAAPSKAIVQTPISGRLDSANGVLNAGGNTQIFITDLVFSNPTGATGSVVLEVNGKALLSLKLDNFRDLDFHFVTPIVVGPGQTMQLKPSCGGGCDPSLLFSGYLEPTG